MDEILKMELLRTSAQLTDWKFRRLSIGAQAKCMAQAFRRSHVVVAIYPTPDGASFCHMLLKGTAAKLDADVQEAADAMGLFCILKPTWFAVSVEDADTARATRDVFELDQYERRRNKRAARATSEFREQLTPRGRNRFAQTKIVERYTQYVRSGPLTLRKIRLARDAA